MEEVLGSMRYPLVSVITTCYNGAKYIRRALECVATSSYSAIEHIVIDDASTDDSFRELQALKQEYSFTLIESSYNRGPAGARNQAISVSKGKYIINLDCDNYFSNDFIETLVAMAEQLGEEYSPFYTDLQWFGSKEKRQVSLEWSLERLLQGPYIDCGCMFSRKAYEQVCGFDEKMRRWEDYEFFLAMALAGFQGKKVVGPLLYYQVRPDSISDHFNLANSKVKNKEAKKYIFLKHLSSLIQKGYGNAPVVQEGICYFDKLNLIDSCIDSTAKSILYYGYDQGWFGKITDRRQNIEFFCGVECNKEASAYAEKQMNIVSCEDVFEWSLKQKLLVLGEIDCIVYDCVVEKRDILSQWLRQDKRLLSKSGKIVLVVPNMQYIENLHGVFTGKSAYNVHLHAFRENLERFSLGQLEEVMRNAGLTIQSVIGKKVKLSFEDNIIIAKLAEVVKAWNVDEEKFLNASQIPYFCVVAKTEER